MTNTKTHSFFAIAALVLGTALFAPSMGCQEQAPAADAGKAAGKDGAGKDGAGKDGAGKDGAGKDGAATDKPTTAADSAGDPGTEVDSAPIQIDTKVALAAKVASAIAAEPEKADDILAQNELDRDKLDDLMYEIASNTEMTRQYKLARATTTG